MTVRTFFCGPPADAFSYRGRSDVDRGLPASLYPDTDIRRLGRGNAAAVQTVGGLDSIDTAGLPFEITRPNLLNWMIGVSASVPVFAGGRLFRPTLPSC